MKKTPRCSGKFKRIADHLSCLECDSAFNLMGRDNTFMMPPRTLGKFMISLVRNRVLGQAILSELGSSMEVLSQKLSSDPDQHIYFTNLTSHYYSNSTHTHFGHPTSLGAFLITENGGNQR